MRMAVVAKAMLACTLAGMLALINAQAGAASQGSGPGGGGGAGQVDPCDGQGGAYREICDTYETRSTAASSC